MPRAGSGKTIGADGALMSATLSSSSAIAAAAPAARWTSPHTSESVPTAIATTTA